MAYGFVTFRSHPNDKDLDDEYIVLLNALLNKCNSYVTVVEDKDTINQHFHSVIEFPDTVDDRNKICQKFKSKGWNNWYAKIKNDQRSTIIEVKKIKSLKQQNDPEDLSFSDHGLRIDYINKENIHDYQKVLGYTCKEWKIKCSKGYSDEFLSTAVKYYWNDVAAQAHSKPKKSPFRLLSSKIAHVTLIDFCKKHEIQPNSEVLLRMLAEEGYSTVDLGHKKIFHIIAEVNLYLDKNDEDFLLCPFEKQYYQKIVEGKEEAEIHLHEKLADIRERSTTMIRLIKDGYITDKDKVKEIIQKYDLKHQFYEHIWKT